MRLFHHAGTLLPLLILLILPLTAVAQEIKVAKKERDITFDLRDLREETMQVPGEGLAVPGFNVDDLGQPHHAIGDSPDNALRELTDTAWMPLRGTRDTVVSGESVHWIRFHLLPDPELRGVPLRAIAGALAPFEIFLNGRSMIRSPAISRTSSTAGLPRSDSLLRASIPITFLCDGRPEIIAVRIEGRPGASLGAAAFDLSLQTTDASYDVHRRMMHFGVFIGINSIILLLSVVIWAFERRERSWLLLALLSLVSALDTFCEVGYDRGALGFAGAGWQILGLLKALLIPWPMYLLIMVLGYLRGDLSKRRAKWYTIGVLVVTMICAAFGVGDMIGVLDGAEGLEVIDDSMAVVVVVIVLAVVFAVIVAWFAVDVVRLALRLVRSKGYARWVGGGALASSLLTLVLKLMSGVSGVGLSAWLAVMADYCSYVAVPASVAVYLAIRSAHHNRLVARQRDELDAEVQERTAQLSAEKKRSDELLLNILPEEVAEELKRTGAAAAKHFDQATVLFTDFKGFTSMSELLQPAELLLELNTCFNAFDGIIAARGIEKIKTIGDAYMCTGGLPDPRSSSPADVVLAALEMQAFMKKRRDERDALGAPAFEMRVGIHSGPVVAGIVGVKKFQYDIWGDTVNTASRMESSGEVGQVNISEATYALVKDEPVLAFIPRGKVQAKGKGEMEMYFVRSF